MVRTKKRRRGKFNQRRRVQPWAVGIAVIIVVGGGMIALQHSPAGSGDATRVALGTPPAVEQVPMTVSRVRRITPQDTKVLLEKGEAVLYDVRSAEAYKARHAVGATSFPEAELATLLSTLPVDKKLVFY